MTEQEITQARADLEQLDIEQLRCGVMLQLLKIEALTKARDECRRQSDLQMNSAIKFCQERNAARIERDEMRLQIDIQAGSIEAVQSANQRLSGERDEYKQRMQRLMRTQLETSKERDEYIRCYNVLTNNAEKHLKELQIRQDCTSFFTARARSLANENLALQAERDALAADAERYSWMTLHIVSGDMSALEEAFMTIGEDKESITQAEFDAVIDAAIKEAGVQ